MIVNIPGFPSEVSDPIELPDIGELLMYPAFQGIAADDFLRYATDFQRYLLGRVGLRHDRRHVIIRSGVWLLEPGSRSHVNNTGDWHFDVDPRVFIMSSPCSALTEFNITPLEIESSESETSTALANRIGRQHDRFGVIGRKIEPCRIYTFDNHLHRAVNPRRIEFRFFLRVKETDEPPFERQPLKRVSLRMVDGPSRLNIEYDDDRVSIVRPIHCQGQRT